MGVGMNEETDARCRAGVDQNYEITAAMIEAGVRALYKSCAIEHPLEAADRVIVQEVFRQMLMGG
jgi:hypothetical protein